jgi:hypothetical protein
MPCAVVTQTGLAVLFRSGKPVTINFRTLRDPLLTEGIIAVFRNNRSRLVGDHGRASQVVVRGEEDPRTKIPIPKYCMLSMESSIDSKQKTEAQGLLSEADERVRIFAAIVRLRER